MKTISFVNMKGGVAKTTLAFNVAVFLSRREQKRVLLIDMDPQFNLTQCTMTTPQYYKLFTENQDMVSRIFDTKHLLISSVTGSKVSEPKEIHDIKPQRIEERLDLLPGTLDLYRLPEGNGAELKLKKYIDSQKSNYDYVIIDTPPTPSIWMTASLIASDGYIIPVKPDPLSRIGIELLQSVVKEKTETYGLKVTCLGLVLTMVDKRSILYKEALKYYKEEEYWRDLRMDGVLLRRADIARFQIRDQMKYKTILDIDDIDLKIEMNKIVKEILKK